jgi:hypothetical protein
MDQNSSNLCDAFLNALKTIRYVKGGADAAEASEELALFTLDEQLNKESKPFGVGGVAVTRAAALPW